MYQRMDFDATFNPHHGKKNALNIYISSLELNLSFPPTKMVTKDYNFEGRFCMISHLHKHE